MTRISFSAASTRTIVSRASDMQGHTYCEECGRECPTRADYEIDHCVAEGVRVGERVPLTADDGKLLCLTCHQKKTRRDLAEIARAKRLETKHRVVGSGQTEIARRYGIKQ
jgi:hypothetical protein